MGRGFATLCLLALLFLHGVWVRLHRSLPQVEGTIALAGLERPVDILRDRYGIPHIYAETETEALFAQGFVHAQDRLFQMDFARRAGQGRLAEVLGTLALPSDKLMRALGLERASARAFAQLPDTTRAALEAYAAGVNAFLSWNARPRPPEFTLLAYRPEPWQPQHSVLIIKLLALQLSTNAVSELVNAGLVKALGPQALAAFLPDLPQPLPPLAALYGLPELDVPHELSPPTQGGASNNWVVSGDWTESGKPLLANDPHLPLTIPSIWYLAHLDVAGRPFIGATMAGAAGIILGRNDRIAWGYTTTGSDVQDLYLERLNPENPDEYLTPSGNARFAERQETIQVRFRGEVQLTVRLTRHGPVLPEDLKPVAELLPKGHVLSVAWPSMAESDGTLAAGHALMKAESCREFIGSLVTFVAPMQNMLCADAAGHIGFVAPGLVPVRKPENDTLGLLPAPGWMAAYDWQGFIPFEALPQTLDPPDGYLATANNRIVPADYPYALGYEWESDERLRRIEGLIGASRTHTVSSFAAMQMDEASLFAREMLPPMLAVLRAAPPAHPKAAEALGLLSGWDGTMSAERPEPLIFMAWLRALTRALIADELDEALFPLFWGPNKPLIRRLVMGDEAITRWCDDKTTPTTETCAHIMTKSFDQALDDLEKDQGPFPSRWRWGRAHPARFSHRLEGFPVIGRALSRAVPSGGGMDTINRGQMYFMSGRPLANVHSAGYRAIYDLNDPEASVFVVSTGQSGNPLSPHYDDLIEAWAYGAYLPMTTRRAQIEKDGARLLRLVPAARRSEATP